MRSISTLVIGVNGEFSASLLCFFEALGDRVACRVETDLDSGLEVLATQQIDLVLVDGTLVMVDDNQTVAKIRAQCPATPIFLLTMFDKDFYCARALGQDVDGKISREKFAGQFVQLLDRLQQKLPGES